MNRIEKLLLDKLIPRHLNEVLEVKLQYVIDYGFGVSDFTDVVDFMMYCDQRGTDIHLVTKFWNNVDEFDRGTIRELFKKRKNSLK